MKHNIIRDNGLNQVALAANWTGTLKMAICLTEPTTLSHVTNASGVSDGKRVTDVRVVAIGEVTLQDRVAGGREVIFAAKADAANGVANTNLGDDLWYAIYDDAYLYQTANESSDKAINIGDPVSFGEIKTGFGNDA